MAYGNPTGFWGKMRTDHATGSVEWHPLVHHSADVAACAEALIERTLLGNRLAHLADVDLLTESQVHRLCVLAALHDFGKFSIAFQNKRLESPPFPSRGHLSEALVQAGYPVQVINPLVVAARRNITIRGTKTDSADALLIARLLNETHLKVCAIADVQVQQLRDLTRLRFQCAQTAKDEKQRMARR